MCLNENDFLRCIYMKWFACVREMRACVFFVRMYGKGYGWNFDKNTSVEGNQKEYNWGYTPCIHNKYITNTAPALALFTFTF